MLIENKTTWHNFLSRDWCLEMLRIGIDMSDASYYIYGNDFNGYCIYDKDEMKDITGWKALLDNNVFVPTYTLTDMLFKFPEDIIRESDKGDFHGFLGFLKDAPFYIWTYYNENENSQYQFENSRKFIEVEEETPILAAARLLIYLHKNNIGYKKYIGDKYDKKYNFKIKIVNADYQ